MPLIMYLYCNHLLNNFISQQSNTANIQSFQPEYIDRIYNLLMLFGFRIKKEKLSDLQEISSTKYEFFAQNFPNAFIFSEKVKASSVKNNLKKLKDVNTYLLSNIEASIFSCKYYYSFIYLYIFYICIITFVCIK